MQQRIIDRLIIVAGQWKRFGDEQYNREFSRLLNQLAEIADVPVEEAADLLLAEFGGTGVAA